MGTDEELIDLFNDAGGLRLPQDIRKIYDPETGSHLLPDFGLDEVGLADVVKLTSMPNPGTAYHTAVLDTGVIRNHPLMRARLAEAVDLTGGDNPEDQHGHGTLSALIATGGNRNVFIHSAKVVGESRTPGPLVQGLQWAANHGSEALQTVSVSCGVYKSRCKGNCQICRAARQVADQGIVLICAGGNRINRVACPATLARERYPNVLGTWFSAPGLLHFAHTRPYTPLELTTYHINPTKITQHAPAHVDDITAYQVLSAMEHNAFDDAVVDSWLWCIITSGYPKLAFDAGVRLARRLADGRDTEGLDRLVEACPELRAHPVVQAAFVDAQSGDRPHT